MFNPIEIEMTDKTETQASIESGLLLAAARLADKTPYLLVPEGTEVKSLETMLMAPTRPRGTAVMRDVKSFTTYVLRENTVATTIYGQVNPPEFMAVFDDNYAGAPGWGEFKAIYSCPLSIEWKTWSAQSGKQLTQEQFARFIEDNLPDIASPPAADMLEISRTLEAKKKVNFASGIRLSNGENQISYEEQVSGTAAKGMITVPEEFTIGIPVLEGGPRYAVTARLRYRIQEGGKLAMWFELVRPHKILEDAVSAVWKQIELETGLKIFNGKAP